MNRSNNTVQVPVARSRKSVLCLFLVVFLVIAMAAFDVSDLVLPSPTPPQLPWDPAVAFTPGRITTFYHFPLPIPKAADGSAVNNSSVGIPHKKVFTSPRVRTVPPGTVLMSIEPDMYLPSQLDVAGGGSQVIDPSADYNLSSAVVDCAARVGKGVYWDAEALRCRPIAGWGAPLRAHELSPSEFTCRDDSVYGNRDWVNYFGARRVADGGDSIVVTTPIRNPLDIFTVFNISPFVETRTRGTTRTRLPEQMLERYGNFMFHTSYLFRQWKRWQPLPSDMSVQIFVDEHLESSSNSRKQKQQQQQKKKKRKQRKIPRDVERAFSFRSYHDPETENLYRMENVCVSPSSGLSGFSLSPTSVFDRFLWKRSSKFFRVNPYKGKQETRNLVFSDSHFKKYLETVTRLDRSTFHDTVFDERPVVFFPIPRDTRRNIGHTLHRILSLIGVLRVENLFGGGSTSIERSAFSSTVNKSTATERNNSSGTNSSDSKSEQKDEPLTSPLLIFVEDFPYERDVDQTTMNETVMGFYFRILDLPYAVVHRSNHREAAGTFTPDDKKYIDFLHEKARHCHAFPGSVGNETSGKESKESSSSSASSLSHCKIPRHQLNRDTDSPVGHPGKDLAAAAASASRVCFRQAVAWQNCFSCTRTGTEYGSGTEAESYSFGMWTGVSRSRLRILRDYRQRVDNCLLSAQDRAEISQHSAVSDVLSEAGSAATSHSLAQRWKKKKNNDNINNMKKKTSSARGGVLKHVPSAAGSADSYFAGNLRRSQQHRKPRVFFDLRLRSSLRRIISIGVIMPLIRRALLRSGLIEDIIFREPWHGSRGVYLEELRDSDIFISFHGGSLSQTVLLNPKSLVLELTLPGCYSYDPSQRMDAWFGTYTQALDHDHWFAVVPRLCMHCEHLVPAQFLIDILKEAACRWMVRHNDPIGLDEHEGTKMKMSTMVRKHERGKMMSEEMPSSSHRHDVDTHELKKSREPPSHSHVQDIINMMRKNAPVDGGGDDVEQQERNEEDAAHTESGNEITSTLHHRIGDDDDNNNNHISSNKNDDEYEEDSSVRLHGWRKSKSKRTGATTCSSSMQFHPRLAVRVEMERYMDSMVRTTLWSAFRVRVNNRDGELHRISWLRLLFTSPAPDGEVRSLDYYSCVPVFWARMFAILFGKGSVDERILQSTSFISHLGKDVNASEFASGKSKSKRDNKRGGILRRNCQEEKRKMLRRNFEHDIFMLGNDGKDQHHLKKNYERSRSFEERSAPHKMPVFGVSFYEEGACFDGFLPNVRDEKSEDAESGEQGGHSSNNTQFPNDSSCLFVWKKGEIHGLPNVGDHKSSKILTDFFN